VWEKPLLLLLIVFGLAWVFLVSPSYAGYGKVFFPFVGDDGTKNPTSGGMCQFSKTEDEKGRDGCAGTCTLGDGTKGCCDYKLGADGKPSQSCTCKADKNPCTNPSTCLKCAVYAESGGTAISDQCKQAVACSIQNRVGKSGFGVKPPTSNVCDYVYAGSGKQYNAVKCNCNAKDPNQKYCKCCAGTLSGAEKAEADKIGGLLNNLDCSGIGAQFFNNAGMDSWAKKNCAKVTIPGCTTFDFYQC
jgi:hypothetical protein